MNSFVKNILWACIIVSVTICTAIATAQDVEQPEIDNDTQQVLETYRANAFAALRRGEYPYAAAMLEQYIEIKKDNLKIYEYLSQIYMHLNEYIKVIDLLTPVVASHPEYRNGYIQLGKAFYEMGLYEQAAEQYQNALDKGYDSDTQFRIGLAYEHIDKIDLARESYEKVISTNPVHSDAIFSLGLLHYRERDYKTAHDIITRALQLDPENHIYTEYLRRIEHDAAIDGKPLLLEEKDNS